MQFQWTVHNIIQILVMRNITFHTIHVHVGALENYTKSKNNNYGYFLYNLE